MWVRQTHKQSRSSSRLSQMGQLSLSFIDDLLNTNFRIIYKIGIKLDETSEAARVKSLNKSKWSVITIV